MNDPKGFRGIEVRAEASPLDKCRKQVVAGQPGFGRFAFIADEGTYMPDGEGTAPTPLTYFVSGVALCLLSHLTEIAGKRKMAIDDVKVEAVARFHEEGSALKGDKSGACDGFNLKVTIESPEPDAAVEELISMARRTCFTVDALTREHPPEIVSVINGKTA